MDKIRKEAKPAELAVEPPTQVGLIISRESAQALGPTIQQSIPISDDKVIE